MSKLSAFGGGDRGRDSIKCVCTNRNFHEHMSQMQAIHAKHPLRQDGGLNTMLRDDVTRLVCPLYSVFLAKQRPDKNAERPRLSLAEVEQLIVQMF